MPTRWKIFGLAVGALLAITLWLRFSGPVASQPRAPAPPPYSVAVRPFLNQTPGLSADSLGPSLTGDLAALLGRAPGLRVADPVSVRAAAREASDPGEIGRRLGVGSVLEGSFRIAGERLRVSVHLVSVDHGFDLWSETFERNLPDLLAIRDSIARGVMLTLRPQARPALEPATPPAGYAAYLRGRAALEGGPAGNADAAVVAFGEAIRIDSSYAPAWAGLAQARVVELLAGLRAPAASAMLAREAADRAIALDSTEARAWLARGIVQLLHDRAWTEAGDALRRAAGLAPNTPDADHWRSHLFIVTGQEDSSLAATREAIRRGPLDPALQLHLAWHHLMAGHDSLARAALERSMALAPDVVRLDWDLAPLVALEGDSGLAVIRLQRGLYESPDRADLLAELARLHVVAGRPEGREMLERLRRLGESRYVSPYAVATVQAALGDTAGTLALLRRAVDGRDPAVVYLARDPRLAGLRGQARFTGLVRRLAPDYNPLPIPSPRPRPSGL